MTERLPAKGFPPDPDVVREIARRIVAVAAPDRIVMFGSAARGEMGPNSDIDILVVKAGRYNRGAVVEGIYRSFRGLGQAVDVVVVTPEEVERYRDSVALIIRPALRDGRVIYAA